MPSLILVEGQEDLAFITSGLLLSDLWDDWRKSGAHTVSVNGKSEFVYPLALAQLLKIRLFVMFDADGDIQAPNRRSAHQRDNERLLRLLDRSNDPVFPNSIVWENNFVIWPENISTSIKADYTDDEWNTWKAEAEGELGHVGGLGKNSIFVSAMMAKAWAKGKASATLEKLCKTLLEFANRMTT